MIREYVTYSKINEPGIKNTQEIRIDADSLTGATGVVKQRYFGSYVRGRKTTFKMWSIYLHKAAVVCKLSNSLLPRFRQGALAIATVAMLSGCTSYTHKPPAPSPPVIIPPHTCLQASQSKSETEDPPVLRAEHLLEGIALKSPFYTIKDEVLNDGMMNHYSISSPFGEYMATGNESLMVLLEELEALQKIEEISNAEIVFDSVSKETINLVTAPARAVIRAGKIIIRPVELLESIIDVPVGVFNFVGTVVEKIEGGTDTISDAVKEAEEEVGGDNLLQTSGRVIERAGKRLLGYQSRYKKWIKKLNIDPYTTNTLLLETVDRIAWLETTVNFSFNFVPGVNGIVMVNRFNRYHKRVRQVADYDDPGVLKSELWVALTELGVGEATKKKFFKHKSFTNTNRFRVVQSLKELKSLENPERFIQLANKAKDHQNAFFYATLAEQLVELERSGHRIVKTRADMDIPVFETSNEFMVVLPADYLAWTSGNALIFSDLHSRMGRLPIRLWTSAALSPRAQKELGRLKIKVSPLILIEDDIEGPQEVYSDSLFPAEIEELFS